jgi:hypothetical protein
MEGTRQAMADRAGQCSNAQCKQGKAMRGKIMKSMSRQSEARQCKEGQSKEGQSNARRETQGKAVQGRAKQCVISKLGKEQGKYKSKVGEGSAIRANAAVASRLYSCTVYVNLARCALFRALSCVVCLSCLGALCRASVVPGLALLVLLSFVSPCMSCLVLSLFRLVSFRLDS